ncbi:heterokaryon incompatibility protein [Colletotrichum kahawae]|uniref:Heterokaryon incompatibility protein n=1 Tax=Colletotrichum kahawae TaxID=34407 RepID=A0AAE0D455_COLKA|nr:heterokaryon incompatibility protein [Colletotrichum kahawae]
MIILPIIESSHALLCYKRSLKRLGDVPDGITNPIYQLINGLEDRLVVDPPKHDDACCDNPKCPAASTGDGRISGPRYSCLDCVPGQLHFCPECVVVPGQGIDHNQNHRLVQLLPTICAICQGVTPLEVHPGKNFRGLYREYSASGATHKRVAEARACGFCSFVWTALLQHHLDNIQWPPDEDTKVTIRVRQPWSSWLEIAVVANFDEEESNFELQGEQFTSKSQNVGNMERELQVGPPMEWSHEMGINPLTSDEQIHVVKPTSLAKVQPYSGSDEALLLAKKWLHNCLEQHTTCNIPGPALLPTRVIDLHGADHERVYLRETQDDSGAYAALSYCWGSGAPGLITTTKNYHSHLEGIEIQSLPKTIRDAIRAARKLDLRYLWVDRLCIIQDSAEDWAHEAALMCEVYSGATLTLSADGSNSATQGLFQTDQALSKLDYRTYIDPDGNVTPMVLIKPQAHPTVSGCSLGLSQPIDSRGWTMQERLMSRRVLHFTSDELAWECDTLTESSDTGPDEYLAGLWRRDLVAQLAWKPPSPSDLEDFMKATNRRNVENIGDTNTEDMAAWMAVLKERNKQGDWHESGGYVAPTWSWAHLRGPMSYLTCLPRTPFVPYADVIEAQTVPVIPEEPTGQLCSGSITLYGHMVHGLNFGSAQGIYEDGTVQDICFLSLEKHGYRWSIEFEPDDVTGLTRRRGCNLTDVAVFLLGTKDFKLEDGKQGAVIGVSKPTEMSRRKQETEADILEAGVQNLNIERSIPHELSDVFRGDLNFARWSSYLVLVESLEETGKYERIGCFDAQIDTLLLVPREQLLDYFQG